MKNAHFVRSLALAACAVAQSACAGAPATSPMLPASLSPAGQPVSRSAEHPATLGRATFIYAAGAHQGLYSWGLGTFLATKTGNVKPDRFIGGSSTDLYYAMTASVRGGGDIYTCNLPGSMLHFSAAANGDVVPASFLAGSNVPLKSCGGAFIDAAGNFVADNGVGTSTGQVYVWSPGASGNVAPAKVYAGSQTLLDSPSQVTEDALGRIWVVNQQGSAPVEAFGSAQGNVAPAVRIAGPATHLKKPVGIAIHPRTQQIAVSDNGANSVFYFAVNANGNVAPVRTIAGPNTKLNGVYGIAVDYAGYTYVSTCPGTGTSGGSILVFAPGANGNVAPVQDITGPNVWFTCFTGLTVK